MAKRIYKDEIDEAVRRGDYVQAGYLERERNKKIDNEKLPYAKTNEYSAYLDRDYGDEILAGIRRGDSGAVAEAMKYREQKTNLPGYTKYNDDEISRKAQSFTEFNKVLNQPFSYENGKAQLDARQRELDNLIGDLRNYKEFEYNAETDPAYAELAKLYTRNGQRAMQDTLGEVSARTGGMASSYAATAGNQAYANYMSELGSKIPELRQLAYQMYQDKYNRALQGAQLAQNRYESDLVRFNNERNFAYNLHGDQQNMAYNRMRDLTSGERYNEELDYARKRDAKADEIAQREWDYGVKNDEYNKALAKAQTLASAGDFSGYKDLGYTDDEIAVMKRAYQEDKALKQKKASGGGSGGKPKLTFKQMEDAIASGNLTPNVLSAYKYYYGADYEESPEDQIDPTTRNSAFERIIAASNPNAKKSKEEILAVIREEYDGGAISENDVLELIKTLGL